MEEKEKIPPFIQQFLDKMEYEGYADFVNLSRKYYRELESYPGKHATQSAFLNDFNRTAGKNHQLDYEGGLKRMEAEYKKSAYETAKKHGFKGIDPNQLSEKEFSKQGVKFQDMIDKARQPKPKQETEQPSQKTETDHIEALKDQQSYQQNIPNVEFKTVAETPSSTGQESREQQRAAFLDKIRSTRQQLQHSSDREPEL